MTTMTQRGFGAAKAVKEQMDQRRSSGAFTPNLILKDGDVADIIFNGADEEPLIGYEHSIKNGNDFSTEWCAKDVEGHDGCVCCHYSDRGDKRVGKPSAKGLFNVVDTRWIHKVPNARKTAAAGGKEKFDYIACSDDVSCKLCKQKVDRERSGQKVAKFAMQWVQVLGGVNDTLSRRCTCGGKTKLIGYKSPKGKILGEVPDGADESQYEKQYECSKCDEASPRSIFNTVITVTRTGGGVDTAYSFTPNMDEEVPEWTGDFDPIDLEATIKPRHADAQAEKLGVVNPFDSLAAHARPSSKSTMFADDLGSCRLKVRDRRLVPAQETSYLPPKRPGR